MAAQTPWLSYVPLEPGYLSGGSAMLVTIVLMILLDTVPPPAVATSLSFASRAGNEKNLVVFGLALAITAMLVVIERLTLWLLTRSSN